MFNKDTNINDRKYIQNDLWVKNDIWVRSTVYGVKGGWKTVENMQERFCEKTWSSPLSTVNVGAECGHGKGCRKGRCFLE